MKISWNQGASAAENCITREYKSFKELCQTLKTTTDNSNVDDKHDTWYLVRGELRDNHRNDENLISASILWLDFDSKPDKSIDPKIISEKLDKLGINHFIQTSSNHKKDTPKYHLFIPCSVPDKASLIPTNDRIRQLLGDPPGFDASSNKWSQACFLSTNTDAEYYGNFDLNDFKSEEPDPNINKPEPDPTPVSLGNTNEEMLTRIKSGKGSHQEMLNIVQQMAYDDVPRKVIEFIYEEFLNANPRKEPDHPEHSHWKTELSQKEYNIDRAIKNKNDRKANSIDHSPVTSIDHDKRSTHLPRPPGALGVVTDWIMSTMRYENLSIATMAAEHAIGVFGGGHYCFHDKTTTRKRIILGPSGCGKSTPGNVMNKIVDEMLTAHGNMSLKDAPAYLGSEGFSFTIQQEEIQEHRVRSFIVDEAGVSGQSKAGDQANTKAMQLEVLSKNASDSFRPKVVKSNAKAMKPVFGCVWVYMHLSTLSSYADLIVKTNAFESGEISRADILFVEDGLGKTNRNSYKAKMPEEVSQIFQKLIVDFAKLDARTGVDAKNIKLWEEVDVDDEVEDKLNELEDEIKTLRNQNFDDPALSAPLVRKYEKILTSVLIYATADAADTLEPDMQKPRVTIEHLNAAIEREDALYDAIKKHNAEGGVFSDQASIIVQELVSKMKVGGVKAQQFGCKWDHERNSYVIKKSYIKQLLSGSKMTKFINQSFNGDKNRAGISIINEMLDLDYMRRTDYPEVYKLNNNIVSKEMATKDSWFDKKGEPRGRKRCSTETMRDYKKRMKKQYNIDIDDEKSVKKAESNPEKS